MPYQVGQFLINKHTPEIYYLITEATEQVDGNFKGHYFYRYVYTSSEHNRIVEPNEVLEQCFYSFQDRAANFSLANKVPEKIVCLALNYTLEKIDKWSNIYNNIPTNNE